MDIVALTVYVDIDVAVEGGFAKFAVAFSDRALSVSIYSSLGQGPLISPLQDASIFWVLCRTCTEEVEVIVAAPLGRERGAVATWAPPTISNPHPSSLFEEG